MLLIVILGLESTSKYNTVNMKGKYIRITENSRLATAAAAIVQRIINRRRPLVFLPVLPSKEGSVDVAVIVAVW
jgi:hypothetical protein